MTIVTAIEVSQAKQEFSELIQRTTQNRERIILTRRGKEIAALIPIEDLSLLQAREAENDLRDALDALNEARDQGVIDLEQFKDELDGRS